MALERRVAEEATELARLAQAVARLRDLRPRTHGIYMDLS